MSLPIAELDTSVHNIRVSIMMGVVGFTVLIYDHVLTFADEIKYIWKADRSLVSFLFFINRYITPVVLAIDLYDKGGISDYISQRFCITWYYTEAAWYICSFAIIHILVIMRVIAIWGRPRWIIILLTSLWLAYFSISCSVLFSAAHSKAYTVHYDPLLKLCYLTISHYLWACWVAPIILEGVLFVLSWIQISRTRQLSSETPLLYVLFRDGALHFAIIVFCSCFNMIVWIIAPPSLVALAKYFSLAIVNVMISRLVLNLRSCRDPVVYVSSSHTHAEEFQIELSPTKSRFSSV